MSARPAPAPPDPARQHWTPGAKDVVTTSLTGRVWAALGQGVLNEIYWPAVDQPQVRDFGFLVVGPPGWRELRRVGRYVVSTPEPAVPVPTIVHTGDFSRLDITVIPDPDRDALLVSYALTGTGAGAGAELRLYPLLAPHLGRATVVDADAVPRLGADNSAWVDPDGTLLARDGAGERYCALVAEPGFARGSAGYSGWSDGWTDLAEHGAMTWTYASAGPGTVALMGELVAPTGTLHGLLALGFGSSAQAGRAAAQASIAAGASALAEQVRRQWTDWAARLTMPAALGRLDADMPAAVRQSAAVLQVNEDRTVPGAFVAGLAIPWGDVTNDPGGYHLVWCRDAVETGLALSALGDTEAAGRLLEFLAANQQSDPQHPAAGYWPRCLFVDGTPMPGAVQLDEVAFPILLAGKLAEIGVGVSGEVEEMVRRAGRYLARHGPVSGVDRWEETPGGSPFTLGLEIAALLVAAERMAGGERDYLLALADEWNERLEQFSYVTDGVLDRAFGTAGHYVRIGGPTDRLSPSNQPGGVESVAAELMVGLDFGYLVRLGLRAPDDARITDSITVVEAMLGRDTPAGRAYYRYDLDGYGEWLDGSGWPVRGFGIGRPWPLLTGERGHLAVLAGGDAGPHLRAMLAMRGRGGLLPEQIWDTNPLPWRNLYPGRPTGSAMPLAWAHSELIKLAVTATTGAGRPVERLALVEARYPNCAVPRAPLWRWRRDAPVPELPAGRALAIEDDQPCTLHLGYDGWDPATITDVTAEPLPVGRYGVTLAAAELDGHRSLHFVRRYQDGSWEGQDNLVRLGATDAPMVMPASPRRRAAVTAAGPGPAD